MAPKPESNASLLLRIRDAKDHDAWSEFSKIYRPAIVRLARHKGLQNADAEDLAQKVLIAVSKAIKNFEIDPNRASFRTWLNRVTLNAVINGITRQAPDRGSGNTNVAALLDQRPANGPDSDLLEREIRQEVFRFAAEKIQSEFHEETWQAFWLTSIEGCSVPDVAKQLGKNRGSIYASRSRVMRRLKEKVQELELIEFEQEEKKETNERK